MSIGPGVDNQAVASVLEQIADRYADPSSGPAIARRKAAGIIRQLQAPLTEVLAAGGKIPFLGPSILSQVRVILATGSYPGVGPASSPQEGAEEEAAQDPVQHEVARWGGRMVVGTREELEEWFRGVGTKYPSPLT